MWTPILVLAIALNFEPVRFAIIPMLLTRRNPIVQLWAYYLGGWTMSLTFGLLILFVFQRNPLGTNASTGGKVQIVVGLLALAIAVIMLLRQRSARSGQIDGSVAESKPIRGIDKALVGARAILRKGGSPWFAGLLGMGVGLPSVDFLAVLVIIATSHKSALEQTAALVIFCLIGGFTVMAPLLSYLFAPAKTLRRIEQFAMWSRSRSQVEYAALLAMAGVILIGIGWSRL